MSSKTKAVKNKASDTDYTVLRSETLNCFVWGLILLFIYKKFSNKPSLFTNPSSSNDIWLQLLSSWSPGGKIRYLYTLLSYIFAVSPFIAVCLFYDIIYKYKIFTKYRIQKPYDKYPSSELVKNARIHDLILMLIFFPLSSFFTFNRNKNYSPIPNVWIICKKLLLSIYTFDILFYLTHRLFHCHPFLYKFHKQHHEFKVSIAWSSAYSSLAELLCCTAPSTLLPIIIYKLHPITTLLYYTFRQIETTVSHSGYNLPAYISPIGVFKYLPGHYEQERLHDFHHSHNDGCFGFYFIDALFGTNAKFRKYYFDNINKKLK